MAALDRYLKEIGSEPLLTREEEAELARRIREGDDDALAHLVEANLRFVVSIAKRYQNRGLPLSDLVNEGNLGLIRAARRFDERREVRFISYAVFWVRQAILQALGEADARGPDDERIRYVSLQAPMWETGEMSLGDVVADESLDGPDERIEADDLRHAVDSSLTCLPEREQLILRLYFGLDDGEPRTLGEIGDRLRISRERARQLKERALARLRVHARRGGLEGLEG